MAKTIQVTPEELEYAATRIEELADGYKEQYDKLYSETSAMATTWSGKDNVAFVNQIDGFKDDFKAMYELMRKYADFLKKSAKAYHDTQEAVAKEAGNLKN